MTSCLAHHSSLVTRHCLFSRSRRSAADFRRAGRAATSFSESFGNGSILCWASGPSTCTQTWAVASGSGQSIATCPTGGTVPATNCLKLTPGAATELDSYGTMPYIPQSSGAASVLTFSYYYTSTTVTAYHQNLILQYVGAANNAYNTLTSSSGSGQIYWNDGNTAETVAINTWHTVVVSLNGASSYSSLDGGTHQTFTAPAYDYYEIRLLNDGNSANVYFGPITITSTYGGGWPPSAYADWAGGSGTATAQTWQPARIAEMPARAAPRRG